MAQISLAKRTRSAWLGSSRKVGFGSCFLHQETPKRADCLTAETNNASMEIGTGGMTSSCIGMRKKELTCNPPRASHGNCGLGR